MPKAKKKAPTLKKQTKRKPAKKIIAKRAVKKVSAIPKGYNSITTHLTVSDAGKAIEFYKKIFTAKEQIRMQRPDGKIAHAELKIGDSKIMLADECPEMGEHSPEKFGGAAMGFIFT